MIVLIFFFFPVLPLSLQLEANYFTILQWFLSYIDKNQPWIYMYSPKYGTLHEFSCHPCAGVMLVFSVSFQFCICAAEASTITLVLNFTFQLVEFQEHPIIVISIHLFNIHSFNNHLLIFYQVPRNLFAKSQLTKVLWYLTLKLFIDLL